jgi:hypothetical protein
MSIEAKQTPSLHAVEQALRSSVDEVKAHHLRQPSATMGTCERCQSRDNGDSLGEQHFAFVTSTSFVEQLLAGIFRELSEWKCEQAAATRRNECGGKRMSFHTQRTRGSVP